MAIFYENKETITLSGETFPLRCDLMVLEQIQEQYGDISDFEYKLIGFEPDRDDFNNIMYTENGNTLGKYTNPDIPTVGKALALMVNEGMAYEEQEPVSEKKLKMLVDIPLRELADILHEVYLSSFRRKNQEATPDQSQTEEKK